MKTLIVATDFSEEAENAVAYVSAAAQHLKTDVVIFNSFNIPLHVSNARLPATVIEELLDSNRLLLRNKAEKLSEAHGIKVVYESSFMQLEDELSSLFQKYDARVIAIGTTSRSLGQDLFSNSNTTALLKLKLPVLAIPEGVTYRPIKKILFACDVLRGINVRIFEEIRDIATLMGAEIEVFHVKNKVSNLNSESTDMSESNKIEEGLEGVPHSYKHITSDRVIDEIKQEVNRVNADLLVMVPQRYGFWKSLTHRSKTRIMASQSQIPLLSIPI